MLDKRCTVCVTVKPLSEFNNRQARCAACERAYHQRPEVKVRRKKRLADPDVRQRENEASRVRQARRPEAGLYRGARRRALEQGISFTIAIEDIVIPERCPIFDVRLTRGVGGKTPSSPSLDRIDPTRGYEPENVWVISYRANAIKNDGTPEEHERIAAAVRHRLAFRAPESNVDATTIDLSASTRNDLHWDGNGKMVRLGKALSEAR